MRAMMKSVSGAAVAIFLLAAAESPRVSPAPAPTYADLADLALPAPLAAHVRLHRAVRLKPQEAGTVPAGNTRFFIEADVLSLIRGAEGLPSRVSYLADLPNGAGGKPPKPAKKSEFILIGSPVPNRPGEIRLAAPEAHLPYTAERANTLRALLREASAPGAAPRITGIGKAFHAPGSLPGESETQIFLQTAQSGPVSLSVLRRPGETPRWALALGEMVDDAAAAPKPNSLLWYRLACTLPRSLPPQSLADAEAEHRGPIQADYRLILDQLGPCARTRG
jgi:hypothetical protein